jgi:hypothetical protein
MMTNCSRFFFEVYLGLNLDTGEMIAVKLVELVGDISLHHSEVRLSIDRNTQLFSILFSLFSL